MKTNYLVFSDLDGTLLDHDSYSFAPAKEALGFLKSNSIPLILTTSKTFKEVVELQSELGIRQPFIVENGAGIFLPGECKLAKDLPHKDDWIKVSHAKSYIELRLFFCDMKKEFPIRGFGDMSLDEVVEHTGLDEKSASDAMKRDFSEPFLLEDETKLEALEKKANEEGLGIVKGGRFFHLVSLGQDKAHAMLCLTHMYDEYHNYEHRKVALGDSANDFTMLKEADVGVLIPLYDGSFAPLEAKGVLKAKYPGPKGWNSSLKEIFDVK
ncbi:MAG: HAD-IIB family hydrolase [Campylobacterota bacterium]|nr:HAD-IIB family hydrolase [Campylobacterota bacterium]